MSNKRIETNSSAKGTNHRLSVKEGSKIGEVTQDQLDSVERFADKAMAPIDVDFTNHFLDRVTDPRNGKLITVAELVSFFKQLSKYKTQFMEFLRKYSEFVTTHKRYELNIPFVRMGNRLVAKTIMRKPNFLTSNPKFKFESIETGELDKFISEIKRQNSINEANTALQLDKSVREFEALIHKRDKEENEKILIGILNKYVDFINSVLDKFYKHINSLLPKKGLSGKVEFVHQKKTNDSIVNKVLERGKKLTQISDLVRGAILFQYDKDMEEFVKEFTKKSKYIVKIEPKLKGQSEYGYYGAYHVDLNIDGLDVEVQITTKKLWAYKGEAHKIYDKWRSDPTKMDKFDRNLSKKLFFKGNQVKFRENIEDDSEEITENDS
jgi:hypothetical protein